jgi:hypothetical protein
MGAILGTTRKNKTNPAPGRVKMTIEYFKLIRTFGGARAFKARSRCCGISQTVRIGVSLRYIWRNVGYEIWLLLAFLKT